MPTDPFQPSRTEPIDLPEPYGSLAAFLGDLHGQIEAFETGKDPDPFRAEILRQLEQMVVALALMVSVRAGG